VKTEDEEPQRPAQHQDRQPGLTADMDPQPEVEPVSPAAGKLHGKVAVVTGGDSGIGQATAIALAREGADVAVLYLDEHADARDVKQSIEGAGRRTLLMAGDVGREEFCEAAIARVMEMFGRIDILVNNAAEQHPQERLEDISAEQLEKTFRTNIFGYFFLTKAALKHLKEGAAIINTTSVTAYRGSAHLVDYSATKGAIVAFTRSLALQLAERGIRVNGVAPGPIWTPLIPSTFPADHVATFGSDVPMKRAGEPAEVAPCYVFLASADSSYMTGQVLHPNGGEIVNA
jgi:NAD(P)-dependent dehydrogenase (short-subunit alcohol dehydrogenase family)